MKKIQTRLLKILLLVVISFSNSFGAGIPEKMKLADSLFKAKQYTQSFDNYQLVLKEHHYSPAMLMKMAYIQEGLGHTGLCMYYLNLYYLASDDPQALIKMTEMATKFRLDGYEFGTPFEWGHFFRKNGELLMIGLASLLLLLCAIIFFQKRKGRKPVFALVMVVLLSALLFFELNLFRGMQTAIISQSPAYLMTGPSAGSSVARVAGEGHQLVILGKEDIWIKVLWKDQEVYIKESNVLPIEL
jgi:hypothetical protein